MKYIILLAFLMIVSMISRGQNHLFDNYENQMNENYGYNGPSVQEASQGAFNILYEKFGQENSNRLISFSTNDWTSGVLKFIKVGYDNLPLLNEPDLKEENLKVLGFTKAGEVLQLIEYRQASVTIVRPGGWQLRSWGDWYQIKTLKGEYGWFFAKPYGLDYSFASEVEKVIPNSDISNKSNFPIGTIVISVIIIVGLIVFISSRGSSSTSTTNYGSGSYSSSSYSSGDSSPDSHDTSSYSSEDGSNDNFTNNEEKVGYGTRRCEDCQCIDLGGLGFTSKGNGRCKECDGKGYDQSALVQFMTLQTEDGKTDCKTCYGTGQCQTCGGTGEVYY